MAHGENPTDCLGEHLAESAAAEVRDANEVVRCAHDDEVGMPVTGEIENFPRDVLLGGKCLPLVFSDADVGCEIADLLTIGLPDFPLEGSAGMGNMQDLPFGVVQPGEASHNHGG